MFLSALALAAALQAAPVAGQEGFQLEHKPFDWTQAAKKRTLPLPMYAHPWTIEEAAARARRQGGFKRQPPRTFVVNPQMVNCKNNGPELVASNEALLAKPLSKMPKAYGERAVVRMVDGCPVAVKIAQGPIER